jgi:hypothetical protein
MFNCAAPADIIAASHTDTLCLTCGMRLHDRKQLKWQHCIRAQCLEHETTKETWPGPRTHDHSRSCHAYQFQWGCKATLFRIPLFRAAAALATCRPGHYSQFDRAGSLAAEASLAGGHPGHMPLHSTRQALCSAAATRLLPVRMPPTQLSPPLPLSQVAARAVSAAAASAASPIRRRASGAAAGPRSPAPG